MGNGATLFGDGAEMTAPLLAVLAVLAEIRAPNADARTVALWGLHLARANQQDDPMVFEAFARQLLRLQ